MTSTLLRMLHACHCEETSNVYGEKLSYNHVFKNSSDYLIKIFYRHVENILFTQKVMSFRIRVKKKISSLPSFIACFLENLSFEINK